MKMRSERSKKKRKNDRKVLRRSMMEYIVSKIRENEK